MNRSLKGPAVVVLAVLGVALLGGALWLGQTSPTQISTNQPASQTAPEPVLAEQVVELPEDAGECHLSLFVGPDWRARPADRRLVAWFDTEPRLVSLRSQCHFHLSIQGDALYGRFAAAITTTPAVVLQRADGKVLYKASGANMPPTSAEMAAEVGRLFPNRPHLFPILPRPCPGPNCPKPEPPKPNVDVNVVTPPPPVPDVRPDVAEESKQVFIPLLIIGGIVSLVAGVAIAWRNEYHG